jgi:hypothetical protein
MSFENTIISEKYLNKLIELNKSYNTNYFKSRNSLLAKYLLCDRVNKFPIGDTYLSLISSNSPFIIKTDLFTELNELNYILNQGGLIENVKELNKHLNQELNKEFELRKSLDEGQIIERNLNMLEEFKNQYGYDPTYISVIDYSNNDGINIDNSDNEIDTDFVTSETNNMDSNHDVSNQPEKYKCDCNSKAQSQVQVQSQIQKSKIKNDPRNEGVPSLEYLNQISEIVSIDFEDIINDIFIPSEGLKKNTETNIDVDEIEAEVKPKKRGGRKTKAQIAVEEEAKKIEEANKSKFIVDYKPEINDLIKKALILKKDISTSSNTNDIRNGIEACLTLADHYKEGTKLRNCNSNIKSNMIYLFLIKKFKDPEAMYQLGEALINGDSIIKNHLQGAKFIKVAAEEYKYPKAITKMKNLTRIKNKLKDFKCDSSDEE